MSVSKHVDLFCDQCGNWHTAYPETTAAGARKRLRQMGWSHVRVDEQPKDMCPECTGARRQARAGEPAQ